MDHSRSVLLDLPDDHLAFADSLVKECDDFDNMPVREMKPMGSCTDLSAYTKKCHKMLYGCTSRRTRHLE